MPDVSSTSMNSFLCIKRNDLPSLIVVSRRSFTDSLQFLFHCDLILGFSSQVTSVCIPESGDSLGKSTGQCGNHDSVVSSMLAF